MKKNIIHPMHKTFLSESEDSSSKAFILTLQIITAIIYTVADGLVLSKCFYH
jgi:hypothetical protein